MIDLILYLMIDLGMMFIFCSLAITFFTYTVLYTYFLFKRIKKEPTYYKSRKFYILLAQLANTYSFNLAFLNQFISSDNLIPGDVLAGIGFASLNLMLDLVVIDTLPSFTPFNLKVYNM